MSNASHALRFTHTKRGYRTVIVVNTGEATQEALVDVVRNYNFQFPKTGSYAWTATSKWQGQTRTGHGCTREQAVEAIQAQAAAKGAL